MTGACVYEAVAAADLESFGAEDSDLASENSILRSRIADLEAAVAEFRAQLRESTAKPSRKRQRAESGPPRTTTTTTTASATTSSDKDGVYYGRSFYLGGPAAPDLLQRMMSLVPNGQTDILFAFSGGSNVSESSATTEASTISNDCMFPTLFPATHGVREMLGILEGMGRPFCDSLLDAFYDLVDPLYHYVPTPWLMQRYERCWDAEHFPQAQEAALIFAVLALGDIMSGNTNSRFLLSASVQLLRISNFFATPSMDSIHTFCYIGVYLQHEGRLGEYWPMLGLVIRLAQSMALHRDPSLIAHLPAEEGEIRRRLFCTIAAQETALSVMFGRPNGIGFTDCKLPQDISDEELLEGSVTASTKNGANEISYHRYTWELAEITRDMVEGAFLWNEPDDMSRVYAIESRIRTWFEALPSHFKFDIDAKQPEDFGSPESKRRYVQSLILYFIVNHNILVLFRKPVLTGASPAARKPCFEAAFAVVRSWKILQDNFPKMARVTWMHWFRAFHGALICLVAIRADGPRSEFRDRALYSWNSCLRVFARLKDQNGSILGCWRALSRLDVVVKKAIEGDRRARRYSNQKQLRDSSAQLLIVPAPTTGTAVPDVEPASPDGMQEDDQTGGNASDTSPVPLPGHSPPSLPPADALQPPPPSALSTLGLDSVSEVGSEAAPGSVTSSIDSFLPMAFGVDPTSEGGVGAGMSELMSGALDPHLFDMDIQNWPSWLTNQDSPQYI